MDSKGKIETDYDDAYENLSDNEDIDIANLTSNKIQKSLNDITKLGKKLFVILEHANLELSTGKKFGGKLITSEDSKLLKIMNKSKEDYRPDVTHHVSIKYYLLNSAYCL